MAIGFRHNFFSVFALVASVLEWPLEWMVSLPPQHTCASHELCEFSAVS